MKNIYLIVGPSGSGKTMVANRLEEKYRLKQVLSYTERPPRFEGEGGHTFVTPEEFDKLEEPVRVYRVRRSSVRSSGRDGRSL